VALPFAFLFHRGKKIKFSTSQGPSQLGMVMASEETRVSRKSNFQNGKTKL
jgi:hypothetical protein